MIALLLGLALAEPPVGLTPTGARIWGQAERFETSNDDDRAARLYRSLYEVERRPEVALAAASAFERAGQPERAEAVLRSADADPEIRIALAELLLARGAAAEAAEIAREAESIWGEDARAAAVRARALARVAPDEAIEVLQRWLDLREGIAAPDGAAAELGLAVAAARLDAGDPEGALSVLDAVTDAVPAVVSQLANLRDEATMRAAARRLARLAPSPLQREQSILAAEARAALAAGRIAEARALLEPLVDEAPGNPELRGLRAQARRLDGAPAAAEEDLRAAEALDPLDPRWPTELGDLLDEVWAGRFAAETFAAWGRALQLRPDQPALRRRWARLGLILGRAAEVEAALQRASDDDLAAVRASLSLPRAPVREVRGEPGCPSVVPIEACESFYLAYAYARRGAPRDAATDRPPDRDRALKLVHEARAAAPGWARPYNLEASLLLGGPPDQVAQARPLLERSLDIDPDQPEIRIALGRLLDAAGDHELAVVHWQAAARHDGASAAPAHLYLAERAWRAWRPRQAAEHLARFRERSTARDPALAGRADQLSRQLAALRYAGWGGGSALALALVVVAGAVGWRRSRRRDVDGLLRTDRACWREVAAVAASIRHEVLKHELGALAEVATALERGDPEPGRWLADRVAARDGPLQRARERLAQIERLGSARGISLDLAMDATFGPLLRALDTLAASLPRLAQGRAEAAEVRALDAALRGPVDAALRAFVHRLSTVRLDRALLDDAVERARSEGDFAGSRRPAVDLAEVPPGVAVRGFREDLLEVVVNLVRNALAASEVGELPAVRVRVVIEEDPVTAEQTVALRVADRVAQPLTTQMIRSRYIERGLGLTVERATAMGGVVTVEPEPGYAKAVVVRLPLAEHPSVEADP